MSNLKDMVSIKTFFSRQIVSKLVGKWLKNIIKKDVDIGFDEIEMTKDEENTLIHINGYIKMNSTDLEMYIADTFNKKED
jgi:hypothetical protein